MSSPSKNQPYFWIGLLAITIVYSLYYFYFLEHLSHQINLKCRHLIKFLFILASYGTGILTLKKYSARWMVQIWHVLYGGILLLLLMLGIYDWTIERAPFQVRVIADDLQEFLVSPMVYVAIGIISKGLRG